MSKKKQKKVIVRLGAGNWAITADHADGRTFLSLQELAKPAAHGSMLTRGEEVLKEGGYIIEIDVPTVAAAYLLDLYVRGILKWHENQGGIL